MHARHLRSCSQRSLQRRRQALSRSLGRSSKKFRSRRGCRSLARFLKDLVPGRAVSRCIGSQLTGLVCDVDDREGFVESVRKLIDDRVLATAMGVRGRAYAEEHFDVTAIGDRFEAVLEEAIRTLAARAGA
jgi:hypothetical protein